MVDVKITKFGQSCLLVEVGGQRLLIDPGSITLEQHSWDDFAPVSAVLYTHQHFDHFAPELLSSLTGQPVITNADVAALLPEGNYRAQILANGQMQQIGKVQIQAYDLPHCKMQDGSSGPPNTGYLIDGRLFCPGDGTQVELEAEILAVPIAGPTIGFKEAQQMVVSLGARHVVPVHYEFFKADPEAFAAAMERKAQVHCLANGQSINL